MLKPDDILNFGKNKGVKLSKIFKYQPSYIEWAIDSIEGFKIDIESFEKLPNPTPMSYNKSTFKKEKNSEPNDLIDLLKRSDTLNNRKQVNVEQIEKMLEEENNQPQEVDYKFPERIKTLNESK